MPGSPLPSAAAPLSGRIPPAADGIRLDIALARLFAPHSRSRLQDWLRAGRVLVEGEPARPRDPAHAGERVEVWPEERAAGAAAEDLPLAVVHADADLIVLDKAAGQVMHPAPGHRSGTVQNALLFHFPATAALPRAGIVHRLDRGTTGLVAVAHSPAACAALVRALQARALGREYLALVRGEPVAGGTIDAPLGRDPRQRQRMRVRAGGREAVTHYRVRRRYAGCALLAVRLETGRTHQIRAHLAHAGFPVLGDPVYGGRRRLPARVPAAARAALQDFRRQALHACALRLEHPVQGGWLEFESPPPADFRRLLELLEAGGCAASN